MAGPAIDLSGTGGPIAGQRMELKICEWGCGGTFLRPVPIFASRGEKVCPGCRKRRDERNTRHAELAKKKVQRDREDSRIRRVQ